MLARAWPWIVAAVVGAKQFNNDDVFTRHLHNHNGESQRRQLDAVDELRILLDRDLGHMAAVAADKMTLPVFPNFPRQLANLDDTVDHAVAWAETLEYEHEHQSTTPLQLTDPKAALLGVVSVTKPTKVLHILDSASDMQIVMRQAAVKGVESAVSLCQGAKHPSASELASLTTQLTAIANAYVEACRIERSSNPFPRTATEHPADLHTMKVLKDHHIVEQSALGFYNATLTSSFGPPMPSADFKAAILRATQCDEPDLKAFDLGGWGVFVRLFFEVTAVNNIGAVSIEGFSEPRVFFRSATQAHVDAKDSPLRKMLDPEVGNVKQIWNLYSGPVVLEDLRQLEKSLCEQNGCKWTDVSQYANSYVGIIRHSKGSHAEWRRALKSLETLMGIILGAEPTGNVAMHCAGGMHRTGVIFALLRAYTSGSDAATLEADFKRHTGYVDKTNKGGFEQVLLDFVHWAAHPDQINAVQPSIVAAGGPKAKINRSS